MSLLLGELQGQDALRRPHAGSGVSTLGLTDRFVEALSHLPTGMMSRNGPSHS